MLDEGDGVLIGAHGSVVLIALVGPFSKPLMERIHVAANGVLERHPKIGALVLVDPSTTIVDPLAHARGKELTSNLGDDAYCVTLVVNGAAPFQLLIKAFIAAVRVAAKPRAPWKVFSDDDLVEAIAWTAAQASNVG